MSTAAFVIDTIDTNLTEYLVEHGYDVWLFDSALEPRPAVGAECTSASTTSRVSTGRPRSTRSDGGPARHSVQVIAHCVGSMSLLMAGLDGMTGVRGAVCSQVTTHPVATRWQRGKVTARVPEDPRGRRAAHDRAGRPRAPPPTSPSTWRCG